MLTHPKQIKPLLAEKAIENIFFKKHLREISAAEIDHLIAELQRTITPQIDCLKCANCCKSLEPGLEQDEVKKLAQLKQLEIETFKQTFIAFDGDAHYLKTKPCLFLNDCACSIYSERPKACQEYPHLLQKDMKYRKTFWENYSICPIVFNVIEELKRQTHFLSA